jgi:hypothetical protein
MLPMTSDELVTPARDVVVEDPAIAAARRARAARAVASAAHDAADCAELLSALGLSAEEGLAPPPAPRAAR